MGLRDIANAVGQTARRPKASATRHRVTQPNLGLYNDRAPIDVPQQALIDCHNVRVRDGQLDNAAMGWVPLFDYPLQPVNHVLLIERFRKRDGSSELALGTQTDLYRWSAITGVNYITPRYETGTVDVTVGGAVTGTGTFWDTTPASGIRVNARPGDYISFGAAAETLQEGVEWWLISAVGSDTSITLSAYTGGVETGADYTLRQCFNGDDSDIWDTEIFPDAQPDDVDLMFFTNGIEMLKWDSALDQAEFVGAAASAEGVGFASRVLYRFANRLVYGDLDESGQLKPQTARSSEPARPESVTNGNAIEVAVTDSSDLMVGMNALGDFLVFYFDHSVNILEYVGPPVQWIIRRAEPRIGPLSRRAIIDMGDFSEFLSRDGAYRFDGASLEPLAPQALKRVMRRSFDGCRAVKAIGHIDEENAEIQWVMPLVTDSSSGTVAGPPEVSYTEHYLEHVGRSPTPITKRDLPATAMGSWATEDATPKRFSDFSESFHTFDYFAVPWADRSFSLDFPVTLFGDNDGFVYTLGASSSQQSSSAAAGDPVASVARFARFAMVSDREKAHIQRVEPFSEDEGSAGMALEVRVWGCDSANGISTLAGQVNHESSGAGRRFSSVRFAARYVEMEFRTTDANNPWHLAGYAVEAVPMGER